MNTATPEIWDVPDKYDILFFLSYKYSNIKLYFPMSRKLQTSI